jgi:D-amino-acid dehydrogenase
MKKTIIIGGGLLGLSTAYYLSKAGISVTIIEAGDKPASKSSFANAAQLSYSHAEPWSNLDDFLKGLLWIFRNDAPLKFRFNLDPKMWQWLLSFAWQCFPLNTKRNHLDILRLNLMSKKLMEEENFPFEFDYKQAGNLHVYESEKALSSNVKLADFQKTPFDVLVGKELFDFEPALTNPKLKGGIYHSLDAQGDSHKFCEKLLEVLMLQGVEYVGNTSVLGFEKLNNTIQKVITSKGDFDSDSVVIAAGVDSVHIAKSLGITLPIYPIKGYSLSYAASGVMPKQTIFFQHKKAVATSLGSNLRLAGTAEFSGYDYQFNQARLNLLADMASENLGNLSLGEASWHACLRPSTTTGLPVLGRSDKIANLHFATGNGSLGWTQALISGKIAAGGLI